MNGMPDIPSFKGLVTSGTDALIGFGGAYAINRFFGNQWGIFSQFGVPILLADTVFSVKYQNTSSVAQAPLEKGTFASYNKVQDPYKATVTMVKGGGDPTMRGLFIAQLEALSKSTLLFHVITPEFVHTNAAITGYDYAREPQSGARMIAANIHLQEVREASVKFEDVETANPEDAPLSESGEVQTQPVEESVLSRTFNSDFFSDAVSTVRDIADTMLNRFQGVFQ